MIERLLRYCQHDVWTVDVNALTGLRQFWVKAVRLVLVAVAEFQESVLSIRATSLVYTTLLSLVPFLAVTFSVLKAFGIHQQIQPILAQALDPLGPRGAEITTNIIRFVDNLKVGVLGAVGVAGLFYTTYSLIEKIEEALNSIWRVEAGRPLARRITDYLSVVLVGPVFVFTAFGMTASAQSHWLVQKFMAVQPFGHLMVVLTNLLPFFFMCFVFTFIYKVLPYTTVNFSSALVGGITAGMFWQVAGMAFAAFVVGTGRYSAIYSSFAVLILFLIWLYVGWLIVLAGAQVAYYHQHPAAYLLHLRRKHQTPLFREYLTLALLRHITRRFLLGKPPLQESQLARAQGVPLTLVESLINDLVKAGMVFRTDDPQGLVLARPPESIPVGEVLRVVQHQPHSGPQSFSMGTDGISQLLMRRDAAIDAALDGITLRNLAQDPIGPPEQKDVLDLPSTGDFSSSESESSMEEIVPPKTLQS
ncbi:MAG: YihY family inner membrane protein [Nitrospirota bacterium]|nr:YihY family inner membrane protein [Nitrospirota bacterium]MDH5574414.1 YihY family inner membrane protein [Nitrospirota bacterium]